MESIQSFLLSENARIGGSKVGRGLILLPLDVLGQPGDAGLGDLLAYLGQPRTIVFNPKCAGQDDERAGQ